MGDQAEFDVVEDLGATYQKLMSYSKQAHWYCPRVDDNDTTNYDEAGIDDEDVTAATKKKRIEESNKRLELAYHMSLSYGLNADEQGPIEDAVSHYIARSGELLTTCDKCVRNYHMGRKAFCNSTNELFDETILRSLLDIIEETDHRRIEKGVENAVTVLKALPVEKRGMRGLLMSKVGQPALQALFEALCCVSYHKSKPDLLCEAMALVQSTKVLRLGYMVPAMARFLFDDNPYLQRFAATGFVKTTQKLTEETFEWIVQDPLVEAIRHIHLEGDTQEWIDRFWKGVVLILGRLDEKLMTHQLRGLEVTPDIYNLAMGHLNTKSEESLRSILEAFIILLRTAPAAFWAAFGATSPTLLLEQVFNSPAYPALLEHTQVDDMRQAGQSALATAWISVFLQHLRPEMQTNACHSMLNNLFRRFQSADFPLQSRIACLQAGLNSLDITLATYTAPGYEINTSTSFIMINNAMGMVDQNKEIIVAMATLQTGKEGHSELSEPALRVVGRALFLDCSALKAEFIALEGGERVDHGLNSHSGTFWATVMESFRPNDMRLAETVLRGITPLMGVEQFKPPRGQDLPADKARFNGALSQLTEIVATVFQRISEFSKENLRLLYKSAACGQPLFGGLVSAHSDTYAAAVDLLKTLTDQETRKDAICAVLDSFTEQILEAVVVAAKKINLFKTFAAVPNLLKTSGDIVDGLFGTQSGILRTKSSLSHKEQAALNGWWTTEWIFVKTSFQMIESWSRYHDHEVLKEFCRDAMDFADKLFDQYGIMATVISRQASDLTESKPKSLSKVKAQLLEFPSEATSTVLNLLRLKDEHLVGTAVRLICKIVHRLADFNLSVDEETTDRIDQILQGTIKTVLLGHQKAELRKAIEDSWGIEELESQPMLPKKQGRIDSYYEVGIKAERHQPPSTATSSRAREVIDLETIPSRPIPSNFTRDDKKESTESSLAEIRASQQLKARIQAARLDKTRPSVRSTTAVESLKQSRQKEKEEKRNRDAAAIAQANDLRNRTAIVKGEGSGISGLGGVIGKDHAPVKSSMMVETSSEESDGEEQGEEDRMALLRRGGKAKKPISDFEARRRLAAKLPQGPVKKTKIQRTKADTRYRTNLDMGRLHTDILKWDIFHEGDSPPNIKDDVYKAVKARFIDDAAYRAVFYPLLVAEAWKQLSSERDATTSEPFDIHVVNRMTVDSFVEVSTKMSLADNKRVSIGISDIVILSRGHNPLKDKDASHLLARVHGVNRKKDTVEVVYKVDLSSLSTGPDALSLGPNTKIRGLKLTSIVSIEREYAAMSILHHYDLFTEILQAEPSPLQSYNDHLLQPIQTIYQLNRGQAAAIWSAKENDAFTLIQGPPGSGKTKTIAALVGTLLTDQLKPVVQGTVIRRPGGPPAARESAPVLKKLLVCAPSNAAVDELVSRLMVGVTDMKGNKHKINVLRIGRTDKVNANIMDVTLDSLVEKRMQGDKANGTIVSERSKLHERAGKLKAEIAELRPRVEEARAKGDKITELQLQKEIDSRKREQARIGTKIDEDKDSGNTQQRESEQNRRNIQREIISGAHVLCATLSGTGHDIFTQLDIEFETVIIDEAAQSIEMSSLIPLKYGCLKCILVGDPKQLPPTVLSTMSSKFGYEKSLFVRMQENFPDRIHLLDTQYRMHPEISHFPSKSFYEGKLIDGPGLTRERTQKWHSKALLGPYQFFDVKGLSGKIGTSLTNKAEIDVAMQLYARLRSDFKDIDFKNRIAIITPYKGQLKALQAALVRKYGDDILADIDTNTTDAYQGREADIIIFSCVRASPGNIGFLNDIRRMNVGLTRAKSSMWVLGDSRSLSHGQYWKALIEDARQRKRYVEGDVLSMLRKPLANAVDYSTATSKEIEMADVEARPVGDTMPEPKHPVRRPSSHDQMADGSGIKDGRKSSHASASSSNGFKSENSRPPSLPPKPPTPGNGATTRPDLPKLTAVGNTAAGNGSGPGKRTREPSPTESGPARKMPAIPGLRVPGQPKPPSTAAVPGQQLPNGQPLNGSRPKIATAGFKPRPTPKRSADPFLSSKPKPKRPTK